MLIQTGAKASGCTTWMGPVDTTALRGAVATGPECSTGRVRGQARPRPSTRLRRDQRWCWTGQDEDEQLGIPVGLN